MGEFPLAGSAFSAEVKASGQHLRLIAAETGYGAAANIYNLTEKKWIRLPHYRSTLEAARRWAKWEMREYLRSIVGKVPSVRVKWTCTNRAVVRRSEELT
jgi:hypothetical protein